MLRVVYVVVSILSAAFPGILVYLLLWIIVPLEPPRSR
jgi:phage shock protein PspC (stress-responsive transcriptional regulator)